MNSHRVAQSRDPSEELLGLVDLYHGFCRLVVLRIQHGRVTKAVLDDLDLVARYQQRRGDGVATEAPEVLVLVTFVLMVRDLVVLRRRLIGHADLVHAVDAELGHVVAFVVPGGQVVETVRERDSGGRHLVGFAVVRREALSVEPVFVVHERDVPVGPDGLVQYVDAREHAVVFRGDAPRNVYATVEKLALVVACEKLQVRRERVRLATREELARLHGIDEQHELRQREIAPRDGVLHGASLVGLDFDAEVAQRLYVAIDALSLGGDVELVEALDDARHRDAVLGVGLVFQDLLDVEQLELRLAVVRHGDLICVALGGGGRAGPL